MMLEILYFPFVLFSFFHSVKGPQVPALISLGILLS